MSRSGLKMSESGGEWAENELEWVKMSGSGWERVGARFSITQLMTPSN